MIRYYDRQGKPLPDVVTWCRLLEMRSYQHAAETTLPHGLWVSTVWLGLDHNFNPNGPPLIFETTVFRTKADLEGLETRRYSTEPEARAGHDALCAEWATEQP